MVDKNRLQSSKAKWVVPLVGCCFAVGVAALLMTPMLMMEPRDIPVALLSEDAGVQVGNTSVNIGETLVENLAGEGDEDDATAEDDAEGADGEEAEGAGGTAMGSDAVHWMVVDSREEMNELLDSGECYGALVVPRDFSASQVAVRGRETLGWALVDKLPDLASGATTLAEGAQSVADGAGSVAEGAGALAEGATSLASGTASLSDGAVKLADGAATLASGAGTLASGVGTLQEKAPALTSGIGSLASGAGSLAEGAATLSSGAATLASGAAKVDEGTQALATGAGTLAEGTQTLADGAASMASGADTLAGGLSGVNEVLDLLPAVTDKMLDAASDADASALADVDLDLDLGGDATEDTADGDSSDADSADASLAAPTIPKAASLELTINQGKNPMVSSSLGSAVSTLGSASGVEVEVTYLSPLPDGLSMGYTHMILMMMTYLGSYITAVVIYNLFTPGRGRHEGRKGALATVGIQAAYAVACALVVGACATGIIYAATGADISYGDLWLYVAICSLTFQALVLGSLDLFGMAGMAVPVGLLIIGMGTAYLPTEFLPAFYQDFVYPWDPLRFMADGYRGILYMGQDFWNPSSQTLMIVVAIGVAMMLGSAFKGQITQKKAAKAEALA